MKKSFAVFLCIVLCLLSVVVASATSGASDSSSTGTTAAPAATNNGTTQARGEVLASAVNNLLSSYGGAEGVVDRVGDYIGGTFIGSWLGIGRDNKVTTGDSIDISPATTFAVPTRSSTENEYIQAQTIRTTTEPTTEASTASDGYENKSYFTEPAALVATGSSENDIKWVQWYLLSLGYTLSEEGATGMYDSYTDIAVRQFQADNGLNVTGTVDQVTRVKLKQVYLESLENTSALDSTKKNVDDVTAPTPADDGVNIYKILFFIIAGIVIACAIGVIAFILVKNRKAGKAEDADSKYEENWLTKNLGDGPKIGSTPSERASTSENSSAAVREVTIEDLEDEDENPIQSNNSKADNAEAEENAPEDVKDYPNPPKRRVSTEDLYEDISSGNKED